MKVLLVEDESGIRLLLRKIIEKNKEFQVVGETDNLTQAVTLFHRTKPDVVFLDIEISGASGLDCARIIADINPKTKIIFATAYAEYMSNAFEVYAFDYLLKPFNVERVDQTLQRILDLARQKEAEPLERIVKYERGLHKLLVKGRESMSFVDIKDIILSSEGGGKHGDLYRKGQLHNLCGPGRDRGEAGSGAVYEEPQILHYQCLPDQEDRALRKVDVYRHL